MFYYPNVLQRHTGCFSTIWLAATRGIRITRREFLRVNVKRTCSDIVDYVTAKVPSLQPNQPRPRFSLYLSSQLQYGVIVVYHKQCVILLEEAQQTIDRLLRSQGAIRIDMAESDRMAMEVPDNLHMMEEAEGAQDPFFGLMESHQLPTPYKIHQTKFVTAEMDSQLSLVSSPHITPEKKGVSSPPAPVILKEKEAFGIGTAEYFEGDDLPEATVRDIELLMDQPDQFWREGQPTEEETREQGIISSIDQLKETTFGTERDSVWLLDEETGQLVGVSVAAAPSETTPPHVAMPAPPCGAFVKLQDGSTGSLNEEVGVPPLRTHGRGRKRQLIFADPEVQISNRVMLEQIENPLTGTQQLSDVMLNFYSKSKRATPAQLFSAPCGSLLHDDLLSLWKQQASLTVLPGSRAEQRAEGESEQDMEILREESKRRHSRRRETSSESALQPAEGLSVSNVILDMSKEDKSGNDVITPVSTRWSPQEDVQPPMEPIAEENIEMPEAQTDTEDWNMLSWITSLQTLEKVTFDSLMPPEADRSTAAYTLYKLLELLSARQVTVCQTEPYGIIFIKPAAIRTAD
ncbi:REC8 meiotic recombination protein b isoform X2 [Melanotaenia boesemani]|uniref:REC8 meiotic recombination protein b isoform X2 n=1 Tax=Melanotaenia boesemani TaxID=1250792 RepID=UPI001C04677D|nr:REC8 meiotic recombination protein b isoform X2 [Melanotaenia boesemani]